MSWVLSQCENYNGIDYNVDFRDDIANCNKSRDNMVD